MGSKDMLIRHKGLSHWCLTDAPFIGTRINAICCRYNCPGCFNYHLNEEAATTTKLSVLLEEIKSQYVMDEQGKCRNGIILGGLEWTNQPKEMEALIRTALDVDLNVMLYTHMTEDEFRDKFPKLLELPIYIKFGGYNQNSESHFDDEHDVVLASKNQYIKGFGGLQ